MISATSFRYNWSYNAYMNHFGNMTAMEQHPDLQESSWTFRRILKHPRFEDQPILCCPEDISCSQRHSSNEIRSCCRLPLCRECCRDVTRHGLCFFGAWYWVTYTKTVLIFQYSPEYEIVLEIDIVFQRLSCYIRNTHVCNCFCLSMRVDLI